MIFDTHAHYDDNRFKEDLDQLITSLHSQGVAKVVNIGASKRSCEEMLDFISKYDFMYGTIGVHPEDVADMSDAFLSKMKDWAMDPRILAIGEIGLDYYYDDVPKTIQKEWFYKQAKLARELKLPIVVHSRDAAKDTIDFMRDFDAPNIGGVIHCYSYTKEVARDFLNMDFYFGIGGVVTFKNSKKLKEAVEYIPLEKIVVETDCPYLAPDPFRGKRNHSGYISYVLDTIAEIKGISREEAEQATYENAHKLYKLPL